VLAQFLVPKTAGNCEKSSALTRPPLPQTHDQVQVSANAARYGLYRPTITNRSDRDKILLLTAYLISWTWNGKTELTTSYIQRGTNDLNASFVSIGIDLAGILEAHGERRRCVGAEWGGVPSRLEGLDSGERHELPREFQDRTPAENGFWAYF